MLHHILTGLCKRNQDIHHSSDDDRPVCNNLGRPCSRADYRTVLLKLVVYLLVVYLLALELFLVLDSLVVDSLAEENY